MRFIRSVRTFGSFGKSYGELGQLPNLPTAWQIAHHQCTVALERSTLAGHLDLASTDAPTAAGRCVDISHGADPQVEPHVISYQGTPSASMSINDDKCHPCHPCLAGFPFSFLRLIVQFAI